MGNRAITVNYEPHGDGWKVTVTEDEKTLAGTAASLIAARDTAEQLVQKIDSEESRRHVVHLLNGDAFAFSAAYLHARHGLSMAGEARSDADTTSDSTSAAAADSPAAGEQSSGTDPANVPATDAKAARALDEVVPTSGGPAKVVTVPAESIRISAVPPATERHPV